MAKQESAFPLLGSIGKLSFFKRKGTYMTRNKTGVSASRIQNDPGFRRTRENGAEFGAAGKAGKVLRRAFSSLLLDASDGTVTTRLASVLLKVLQSDITHDRGQRTVIAGNLSLAEGFQFNATSPLEAVLTVAPTATIDRPTGQCSVGIASFVPDTTIVAPNGATHYKIIAAAAEIDFTKEINPVNIQSTAALPLDNNATAAINLQPTVTANSTHPLFLVTGIVFYQMLANKPYVLSGFNALQMVKVSAS
jgi:hypothetical protein